MGFFFKHLLLCDNYDTKNDMQKLKIIKTHTSMSSILSFTFKIMMFFRQNLKRKKARKHCSSFIWTLWTSDGRWNNIFWLYSRRSAKCCFWCQYNIIWELWTSNGRWYNDVCLFSNWANSTKLCQTPSMFNVNTMVSI